MDAGDYTDTNPEYWPTCSNLQRVKHRLVREYLSGWFPILAWWAGTIFYIDTHAGRGRHGTGELGSPLVALRTFLDHRYRERILRTSEVRFVLIERDRRNLAALESELAALGTLPSRVHVEPQAGDCEQVLRRVLSDLQTTGERMAPSFIFVDPYSFKIPYPLLGELMASGRTELFVNIMWRYLAMEISQASSRPSAQTTLDTMFGGQRWRRAITARQHDDRAEQCVRLVRNIVDARWTTTVFMLGDNRAIEYMLVHFTNHDRGRELMKQVMWKVCPGWDDVFLARKRDDPAQGVLLVPEPDLRPLARWLVDLGRDGPIRWLQVLERLRETSWLPKHAKRVAQELVSDGRIVASGRISKSADPVLTLGRD